MKIVHLIYLGVNGGEGIYQKYLLWKEGFTELNISYYPIFVSNFPLPKENGYFHVYKEIKEKKFFLMKLIKKTYREVLSFLSVIRPDVLLIRIDLVCSELIDLARRYKTVIEYPFLPLSLNLIDKPFYKKLAQMYEKSLIENSVGMIATLSIFKEHPLYQKKPIFLFPNSLLPNVYKPKLFKEFDGRVLNVLFMSSKYDIYHYNGYDRFLRGLNSFISKNEKTNLNFNLFFAGKNSKEGVEKIVNFYNLKNLKRSKVKFIHLGFKSIEEMNWIVDDIHLGVNDLAVHRKGSVYNTTLKTVDFIGWGLPFILAYEDENLPKRASFFYKFEPSDEPIDVGQVIKFARSISEDTIKGERVYGKNILLSNRIKGLVEFLENVQNNGY